MRWNTGRGQVERAQLLPAPVDLVAEDNEGEVVGVARSRLEKTIGPNRGRGGGTARTCIKNSSRQLLRLSKVLRTLTSNTKTQQSAPDKKQKNTAEARENTVTGNIAADLCKKQHQETGSALALQCPKFAL